MNLNLNGKTLNKKSKAKAAFFYLCAALCLFSCLMLELKTDGGALALLRALLLFSGCCFCYRASYFVALKMEERAAARFMQLNLSFFFVLYAAFVINLTLLDTLYGRHPVNIFILGKGVFLSYARENVNLIPFHTLALYINGYLTSRVSLSSMLTNLLGNLIAFMPFGLFLPLLSKKFARPGNFFLAMLAIVGLIEALQLLLMSGTLDIDDIILNVAGALLARRVVCSKGVMARAEALLLRK